MRVAVITQHGEWSASTRARVLQYVPVLEKHVDTVDVFLAKDRPERRPGRTGQAVYFAEHAQRYVLRWSEITRRVTDYDAVLVQRGIYAIGPGAIVRPLEAFPGRVVYDLDDALLAETPSMQGKGAAAAWLYGPHQVRRLLGRADAIVVSTRTLAQGLPPTTAPVTVLPTVPDVSAYRRATGGGTPGLIGWAGTTGGLPYLDPLREVLRRLDESGTARLRVVSSAPWSGPSEFRPWRLDDEPTMFADFAVGIMPLPDTDYARAKAGYKLLQYMAAGVPVVATAAGAVPEVVGDGAWLVSPGDGDALAARLSDALAGGASVDALVGRGRARASGFSWARCADGLAGLYRDAVASSMAGDRRVR